MRNRPVFSAIALFFVAAALNPLHAAEEIQKNAIQLPDNVLAIVGIHEIYPIDGENCLVLATLYEMTKELGVYIFQLNYKGEMKGVEQVLDLDNNVYPFATAWLPSDEVTTSGTTEPGGILFCYRVLGKVVPRKPTPYYRRLVLYTIPFDASGALSKKSKIFQFNAKEGPYIESWPVTAYAETRGETVGFAVSFGLADSGKRMLAYFIETNAKGKRIGEAVELPLAYNGKNLNAWMSRPTWNGSRWVIPMRTERYLGTGNTEQIDVFVSNGSVLTKDEVTFKRHQVRSKPNNYYDEFGENELLQILPAAEQASPTGGSDLKVFIQRFTSKEREELYDLACYLHSVDGRGRVADKSLQVKMKPEWDPQVPLEQYETYSFITQKFFRAYPLGDGRVVLPLERTLSIEKNDPSSIWLQYRYYSELSFVALNPANGRIQVLASTEGDFGGDPYYSGFCFKDGRMFQVIRLGNTPSSSTYYVLSSTLN